MSKERKMGKADQVAAWLREYPEGVETMLTIHLAWLNGHHERNDEEPLDTHEGTGGMAHYFAYGDVPILLHDSGWVEGGPYVRRRVLMVSATPYHDEGGPAVLTAFFDAPEADFGAYAKLVSDEPHGQMRMVVQEFDTELTTIWLWGRDEADQFIWE